MTKRETLGFTRAMDGCCYYCAFEGDHLGKCSVQPRKALQFDCEDFKRKDGQWNRDYQEALVALEVLDTHDTLYE